MGEFSQIWVKIVGWKKYLLGEVCTFLGDIYQFWVEFLKYGLRNNYPQKNCQQLMTKIFVKKIKEMLFNVRLLAHSLHE